MRQFSPQVLPHNLLPPEEYERRVEAFEAEGLTRSDAQGCVDAEELYPDLRKQAHGLPEQLAEVGFRIEYGSRDTSDPTLRSRWWWTFSDGGDVETPHGTWPTAAEAGDDAKRAFAEGYHLDEDEWSQACALFGLDTSFDYSRDQMREHIRNMRCEQDRVLNLETLLRELRYHIVFDAEGDLTREQFAAMLKRVDRALSRKEG